MSATTTGSSAATAIVVPQQWVFPQADATAVLPIAQTSNFGPVHYGDSMIVRWTPSTQPAIRMSCFSQSNRETTIEIVGAAAVSSGFNYTLSTVAAQNTNTDRVFCHFWFPSSSIGNSVAWEYIDTPSGNSQTWSLSGKANSNPSGSSSSSSSSSSTSSAASGPSSVSSSASQLPTAPSTTNVKSNNGPSGGAIAGIAIGAIIGLIALLLLVWFFIRKKRQQQRQQSTTGAILPENSASPAYDQPSKYGMHEKMAPVPIAELESPSVRHELPAHP